MKTFGKIILGIIVVFFGMTIFNYTNSYAVHKDVGEQGDGAYIADDLTFFKSRFEYFNETPIFEKHVEFDMETEEESKKISFDLYMFQSANVKESKGNYMTILVKDLTVPEHVKLTQVLNLQFEYSISKTKDESFSIVKIGKKNWYLQWINIKHDDILSFKLKHDNLLLYEYDLEEPLLKAEDYDLVNIIMKNDVSFGVIKKLSNTAIDLGFIERTTPEEAEKTYEVKFEYALAKDVKVEEDLYLSGEFNNFIVGDEQYKLKKNKSGIYELTINIESKHNNVFYNISTKEGDFVVDENNNIEYFVYEFLDFDNKSLEDYNIFKTTQANFNKYNHYKWIAMSIYLGALLIVFLPTFIVNKVKKNRAVYNEGLTLKRPSTQENKTEKIIVEEENSSKEL